MASAASTTCLRDSECGGTQACIESTCSTPEIPFDTCTSDDGCGRGERCVDEHCKSEDIVCRNPAGACWVEGNSGSCSCLDGNGSGWSGGFNPDDPPPVLTDEELRDHCSATLAETCGTQAPTLSAACTGTVHQDCEAFTDRLGVFAELCGETAPTITLAAVNACCEEYDDPDFTAMRECVLASEATTCEAAYADCYGDSGTPLGEGSDSDEEGATGGPNPGEDPGSASRGEDDEETPAADADADGNKASCSVVPHPSGGGWLAILVPWLWFCRTRRASRSV